MEIDFTPIFKIVKKIMQEESLSYVEACNVIYCKLLENKIIPFPKDVS